MKKLIYKLLIQGCVAIFCFANISSAQNQGLDVSVTIVDEQGNPIEGVNIFAPNGLSTATDVNGKLKVNLPSSSKKKDMVLK